MAVDNDDAGVAADVAEGLVMWARNDVATVTAHEAELGGGGRVGRRKESLIPRVSVTGTRRGVY